MARPVPLIDRHDRFPVVEEENAPDDLPPEVIEGDGDGAHAHPHADMEWQRVIETPDPEAAGNDDAAVLAPPAEMSAAQPEPIIDTKLSPAKQGGMSVISLALMALVAAGLSAAVVLLVF